MNKWTSSASLTQTDWHRGTPVGWRYQPGGVCDEVQPLDSVYWEILLCEMLMKNYSAESTLNYQPAEVWSSLCPFTPQLLIKGSCRFSTKQSIFCSSHYHNYLLLLILKRWNGWNKQNKQTSKKEKIAINGLKWIQKKERIFFVTNVHWAHLCNTCW